MKANLNWSAPAPGVPPDANVFSYSIGAKGFFLFALLFALVEAVLLFLRAWYTADPTTRITQIPEGTFFALAAQLDWRFLSRSRVRIAVNPEGIWRLRGSKTTFLPWSDMAGVRANDRSQRLELTDRRGVVSIDVDYQIGGFNRLRAFILSHTTEQAQLQRTGMSVFHHTSEYKIVYSVAAALLFFFAWQFQHHPGIAIFPPLVLGIFLLFMILREPTSVVIGRDGIEIHYIGFQRDIPFNSISAVDLNDRRYRGNVWAGVLITTNKGSRIRLTRFREGSVALYEAIQNARKSGVAPATAYASSSSQPAASDAPQLASNPVVPPPPLSSTAAPNPYSPAAGQYTAAQPARRPISGRAGLALAAVVLTLLAMFGGLGKTKAGKALGEALASRVPSGTSGPAYPKHNGPVARLSDLQGSGTVYLVQMGAHARPYSLAEFAQWLHSKYAIDVRVLPPMSIDPSAWDARRHQFVAEQLYAQIKSSHADLARNPEAFLIGFTDFDMYSVNNMWSSTFTQRDHLRTAIISSDGMGDTAWQHAHLPSSATADRFRERMHRILLKDVAVLYWHLPVNSDPSSLLHDPLDPDLPTDDIYASDLDPALSPAGQRIYEPCAYFTYSDKEGTAPLPGPVVRECNNLQDPVQDESVEVFEVLLRFGALLDKHTDVYRPDTIPVEFQRITGGGGYGKRPFGISGSDNYDEVLGSADNIHIFMESGDGSHIDMIRFPEWLPLLPLVKYVGGESAMAWVPGLRGGSYQHVWQYQMAWHALPYEQYDLHYFNGATKTFLPCGKVPGLDCMLVDYHDSQGRELKIDRDSLRRLSRVTSPNGSWVGVATDVNRSILAVDDSLGRTVLYSYDTAHNLASVTYPSGEVYHYTCDDMHHIVAVAVSADARSEPGIVLRDEYQNQMLTKITLPNGGSYTFDYGSSGPTKIDHVTIHTPDARTFNLNIGDHWTTVHEVPAPLAAAR